MRLGLVYLPPADVSFAITQYAQRIVSGLDVRMTVGPSALPHLSLLHLETDGTTVDPARIWADAIGALPTTIAFDIVALGLLPQDTPYFAPPAPPATTAWLMVACSERVRATERIAMALPSLAGIQVTTQNGDRFQPHLTIALWEGRATPHFEVDPDVVPRRDVEATLALGEIGPNGVYKWSLFAQ
jgi:hypothetical protein